MFKKITTILALMALSSVTLASQNGVYVGVQGGHADIDNTASSLGVDTATFQTSIPSLSQLNGTQVHGSRHTDVTNGNWGARIYGGYQFNKFIAAEAGFTGFDPTQVDRLYGVTTNDHVNQGAIDAVGKFMLPLGSHFNLYAKGGASYVITNDFDGSTTLYSLVPLASTTSYTKNIVTALRPTYGVGASVDLSKRLSADISWSQIVGGNNIATTNFAALGLAYHF